MLNKIFLGIYGLCVIAISVLCYYAYIQLQSRGFAPSVIVGNFEASESMVRLFLWGSSIFLLVMANAVLWTNRRSWAMWLTFIYFAGFLLVDTWFLDSELNHYKKQTGLSEGSFQLLGIAGAVAIVIAGIGVYFNQFIVDRLHKKLIGGPVSENLEIESAENEKSNVEE